MYVAHPGLESRYCADARRGRRDRPPAGGRVGPGGCAAACCSCNTVLTESVETPGTDLARLKTL